MENFDSILRSIVQPGAVVIILVFLLMLNSWIFNRMKSVEYTGSVIRRSISFLLILTGILAFILSLPIDRELKGQILGFLGILVSAGLALSSTTVLGNLIAGFMNNSMNRFRNGDLVKINDIQGRVISKSIFHIELQLEDSNFVTIPNLVIATHPVKLTRKTNTVISTSVSLGYDVSRIKIEETLKEAALATELKDPYVYITELGDFSVVYKIHGFLGDSSKFFSTTSLLNAKVMDTLHNKGIEIVSPNFVNQRRVEGQHFIAEPDDKKKKKEEVAPEDLVFDEAARSQELENKKDLLLKMNERRDELRAEAKGTKDKDKSEKIKSSVERLDGLIERIEKNIQEQKEKNKAKE